MRTRRRSQQQNAEVAAIVEPLEMRRMLAAEPLTSGAPSALGSSDTFSSKIASNPAGEHVIVWAGNDQNGAQTDIFAQPYNVPGDPVGNNIRVNAGTAGIQPSVSMDAAGDFVIAWTSVGQNGSPTGILAQRFDSSGDAVGSEIQVAVASNTIVQFPSVAIDQAGDFVIAWKENQNSGDSLIAQRYSSSGAALGNQFQIYATPSFDSIAPSLAMDANGSFVVTWESIGQAGTPSGIEVQQYDSNGTPNRSEVTVNSAPLNGQTSPMVAVDPAGDFVIAWQSNEAGRELIVVRSFQASGDAQGPEIVLNNNAATDGSNPSIAIEPSGSFVVAWQTSVTNGSGSDTVAQQFDSTGIAQGSTLQVAATSTAANQIFPSVAVNAIGEFEVTWESQIQGTNTFIIGSQGFSVSGVIDGNFIQVNDAVNLSSLDLSPLLNPFQDFPVMWQNFDQNGNLNGIFGQFYASPVVPLSDPLSLDPDANDFESELTWWDGDAGGL